MAELTQNAERVLQARYLARDEAGRILEDFDGLCRRVARAVAAAEDEYVSPAEAEAIEARFAALLQGREFLPNSPTLMNAGRNGQLAACFVLPIEDSIDSIFEAVKRMARIHQTGGGTGFSFSNLRPAGDRAAGMDGIATGPVGFLDIFDATTNAIKQGGRRRGANIGVLAIDHPDVRDFLSVKSQNARLTNFNLSVMITDAFWHALDRGEAFDLTNPRNGKTSGTLDPGDLLTEIADHAWRSGDPGVIFYDAVNRANPTPELGTLEAPNPCGELPLLPNESCNLGSLRLDAFVSEGRVDWARLDAAVDLAVRFLDDVIDVNVHPDDQIAALTRANRKIGLGVMGFADLLVDLGVPYDAPQAARIAAALMARISARAWSASVRLAEQRGAFPSFESSRLVAGPPVRNATVTSIAPTGSLSILADCSAGIEPYFALAFVRHVMDGERLHEANPRLESALRAAGCWSRDLSDELRARGTLSGVPGIPDAVRRLFKTAFDIAPAAHLAIQEGFQRHVDNAVSKTINLPNTATPSDVAAIYRSAWERGLKGVTVFREGCRSEAVLVRGEHGEGASLACADGGCS